MIIIISPLRGNDREASGKENSKSTKGAQFFCWEKVFHPQETFLSIEIISSGGAIFPEESIPKELSAEIKDKAEQLLKDIEGKDFPGFVEAIEKAFR